MPRPTFLDRLLLAIAIVTTFLADAKSQDVNGGYAPAVQATVPNFIPSVSTSGYAPAVQMNPVFTSETGFGGTVPLDLGRTHRGGFQNSTYIERDYGVPLVQPPMGRPVDPRLGYAPGFQHGIGTGVFGSPTVETIPIPSIWQPVQSPWGLPGGMGKYLIGSIYGYDSVIVRSSQLGQTTPNSSRETMASAAGRTESWSSSGSSSFYVTGVLAEIEYQRYQSEIKKALANQPVKTQRRFGRSSSLTSLPTQTRSRSATETGDKAFLEGDYTAARRAFRTAVHESPEDGTILLKLGQSLFALGEYNESVGAVEKGLGRLPQNEWVEMVTRHSSRYGKSGDLSKQLRHLESAIRMTPGDGNLRFLVGYQYLGLGFAKQAAVQLQAALELDPQNELKRKLAELAVARAK